jgi:hypothetical protein
VIVRRAAGQKAPQPSFRSALRQREFAALFAGRVLSEWGDQLARVAVASLVLDRSGSAVYAALAFAASYLPTMLGQALLGPYVDRLPRRTLMIVCDLLRAGFVALLVAAVSVQAPIGLLLLLLFLVGLVSAPFQAAARAVLVDVFDQKPMYLQASALIQTAHQFNQVAGVALGGVVVAVLGPGRSLWLDVLSFLVSAGLVARFVRHRPPAQDGGLPGLRDLLRDVEEGARYLRSDRPTRSLMVLAWSMLLVFVAPEAAALPYARYLGESTAVGGLLLAASPFGAALGVLVVRRWPPQVQVGRLILLAGLVPVPLLAMVLQPPWPVAATLFALAAASSGFMVPLMATFALLPPDQVRGRVIGLAGSGFALLSATSYLVVGGLSDLTTPAYAVAICAVGTLAWLTWLRSRWPGQELAQASERAFA